MELTRFPDERYQEKLLELYREKYSAQKIDLIVAFQTPSLKLLMEYIPDLFGRVPVIICAQDLRLAGDPTFAPSAVRVIGRLEMSATLALALSLHPAVRKVFIVSGASRFDKSLEAMAKEELRSLESCVELIYLSGLPLDDLTHRLSILPHQSLVLYLAIFRDGKGMNFKSPEALALISEQANAPIYSLSESYIDSGIVGGSLLSHSAIGARAANVALRIFAGEKPDTGNQSGEGLNRYMFDARQLKRWGISEDRLPPGSDIRYRDFSVWEEYRYRIIGVVFVLIFQASFITILVISLQRKNAAERALRMAADEWQTTFDSTNDQILLLDRQFRVLRANAAAVSFVGVSFEGIVGRHCYNVMHGASKPPVECPCARTSEPKGHEEAVIYDEKREKWLFMSLDPVLDEKGKITGFVHTVKDVTERKRAVEAIEASEEFNRAVLGSLKNHVAILDKGGTILAVNEAWERFARENGVSSLDAVGPGVNYLDVCRRSIGNEGDCASQTLDGLLSVLSGESDAFQLEYSCDSSFESRWFLMTVMPFRRSEGGGVISHTDITLRRKAELDAQMHREQLAHVTRIVTIGELATSLAHEINQPLTAMLCNADAALRFLSSPTPDLEEVRTILEDIIQDDKRAGEVIRRMRTLVKKETPRYEAVLLNDVVWETIALVRNAAFLGGVFLTVKLERELPAVQGDRVQLQQVVMNLLLNATAAMKEVPPALRKLLIRTTLHNGKSVKVSVTDSGVGIAENNVDRLFEPFYTTKADGLGMGLSISRTIIKAHGGAIWAENNDECGATFHFTLPLDQSESP